MESVNPTYLLHLIRKEVKNNILTMEKTIEDMAAHIEISWYANTDSEVTISVSKAGGLKERLDIIYLLNDVMSKNIVFETPIPEEYLGNESWDKHDQDYVSIYSTILNSIQKSLERDLEDVEIEKRNFELEDKKRDRRMLRDAAFCWDTPESVKEGKKLMEDLMFRYTPTIERGLQEVMKDAFPDMGEYIVEQVLDDDGQVKGYNVTLDTPEKEEE